MKITKIYFIRSSLYADNGKLVKATFLFDRISIKNLAEMGIPLLAAYVPSNIEVEMVDDCLEDVDFDNNAEVIAISAWIIHVDRAIDLAKEFKRRGKTVLIGGYLATMHPEIVSPYVDSVCVGEGDIIFPQMIKDIENDCLKPLYESDFSMPLDNIPTPRYDLIGRNKLFNNFSKSSHSFCHGQFL